MKAQDFVLIAAAAAGVWWVLKTYGGDGSAQAAAPRYWVTGGAMPNMYTTYPDPAQSNGVWA